MKSKTKGLVIDLILLFIYSIIIILFIYFGFDCLYKSRLVPALLLFFSIPIYWGTIIASILGKNTVGQRISNKKISRRYL